MSPEPVEMPIGNEASNERFLMGVEYSSPAEHNHGQTLARLAARGGLDWCEAAAIIQHRPWFAMNAEVAEQIVRATLPTSGSGASKGGEG